MCQRQAIAAFIASLNPSNVVDFGGGFGCLARLLAAVLPQANISIREPYPPLYGIDSCRNFPNISYVSKLSSQSLDVLVCTDVLEHVFDPLVMLAEMVDAVAHGGHLLIGNCFFPVVLCHLPCTFHLRYSFDAFCQELGLSVIGPCEGSHATIYRRHHVLAPDWPMLRALERRSRFLYPFREWRSRHYHPFVARARISLANPLHYPRKILRLTRSGS